MGALSVLRDVPLYYGLVVFVVGYVLVAVVRSRSYGLEHVPGPWLSRYTDALRAYMAHKYSGQDVNLYMKLHAKYGDVVRVGPRSISVLDPQAIPTIYGVKARLNKGPNVTAFNVPGVPQSVLSILDEQKHARYRRPIQNAYSLTNLKNYEPYVDEEINTLVEVLDRHVQNGQPINLSLWVYYWSYETIGKLTFGHATGYLEKGADFNGLIHRQKQFLEYVNVVSQMPSLHGLLANNPIFKIIPHQTFDFIKFAQVRVTQRLKEYDPTNKGRPDLLSHFIEARTAYPDIVNDNQVFVYGLTNVIAGSLSTSHVLDEVVKYLTSHPDAQHRIAEEIKLVTASSDEFPISLDQAKKSPFLEGVILEGFRIHSVANLSSEREVGSAGMQLPNGLTLPPGTYVGINPAAMNRRADVFGPHPDIFDPLRWLRREEESEEQHVERRLRMDRATLTFGQGSRSCLGKNIVQLEIFKLIATLCSRFTFTATGEKTNLFEVDAFVGLRGEKKEEVRVH